MKQKQKVNSSEQLFSLDWLRLFLMEYPAAVMIVAYPLAVLILAAMVYVTYISFTVGVNGGGWLLFFVWLVCLALFAKRNNEI